MRPREFVSRVIDLFEFNMGITGNPIKPKNFTSASLAIELSAPRADGGTTKVIELSGYQFLLETACTLGHTIVRATMADNNGVAFSGSVCFTLQEHDRQTLINGLQCLDKDTHFMEAWSVAPSLADKSEEIASMLTFLTLRTDDRIRAKA